MVNTRSSSRLDDDSPPSSATKTPSRRSPRIAAAKATMAADGKTPPTTGGSWRHVPSRLTLLWMAVSLPLVVWDTLYVLLRPLTMEGGALFWPLWVPYRLYGEVDHVYGWVAYNAKEGFTAAQGTLNAVETAMYLFYVYEIFSQSSGNSSSSSSGKDAGVRVLSGRAGARAALVGFSAAVMTLSKTVLYCESPPLTLEISR